LASPPVVTVKPSAQLPKKSFKEDIFKNVEAKNTGLKAPKLSQERRGDYSSLEDCDNDASCPGDF